jgi:RHS repeat-associated protein
VSDTQGNTPIATYSYIGRWRVGERAYPQNGTTQTYFDNAGANDIGYDGLRRPVQLRHINATNDATLVGFAHTYDRGNNPLSETKLHALNDSELYQYDSGYRLLQFDRGTLNSNSTAIVMPSLSTTLQTNWTLDGVGNWETVDHETRQYNSFNELIQRSNSVATAILSDNNGNETNTGALILQYDYRNRLRRVSNPTNGLLLATYAYDARNRRVRKVVTNSGALNGTTLFYLDRHREIEERNGTNGLVQQYVYGVYIDELLVLDRNLSGGINATGPGNQRLFYHQNRQHSIFALTDITGKIVEGYQYEGYGTRTVFAPGSNGAVSFGSNDVVTVGGASALGNPYGLTGRRYDAESGLYYYRNRYMAPDQGRFISRDPINYRGGSVDLYEYVGGRPSSGQDPNGTNLAWDLTGVGIGIILAATGFGIVPCAVAGVAVAVIGWLGDPANAGKDTSPPKTDTTPSQPTTPNTASPPVAENVDPPPDTTLPDAPPDTSPPDGTVDPFTSDLYGGGKGGGGQGNKSLGNGPGPFGIGGLHGGDPHGGNGAEGGWGNQSPGTTPGSGDIWQLFSSGDGTCGPDPAYQGQGQPGGGAPPSKKQPGCGAY